MFILFWNTFPTSLPDTSGMTNWSAQSNLRWMTPVKNTNFWIGGTVEGHSRETNQIDISGVSGYNWSDADGQTSRVGYPSWRLIQIDLKQSLTAWLAARVSWFRAAGKLSDRSSRCQHLPSVNLQRPHNAASTRPFESDARLAQQCKFIVSSTPLRGYHIGCRLWLKLTTEADFFVCDWTLLGWLNQKKRFKPFFSSVGQLIPCQWER